MGFFKGVGVEKMWSIRKVMSAFYTLWEKNMLITIGGRAGSGKGTIAKMLVEKFWYTIISVGDMKRNLAKEMGLNIQDFNLLWDKPENQKEFDLKYEEYQKGLSLTDKIVLDSRLGFYAQPKAFKILLDVDEQIASERILWAKRDTDKFKTPEDALAEVKERNLNDQARYKKLYAIDVRDYNNYTLVVDTSEKTPEEVFEIILEEFRLWKKKKIESWSPDYAFLSVAEPDLFTDEEKEARSQAKRKKVLLKNILLVLALLVIAGFWIVTLLISR